MSTGPLRPHLEALSSEGLAALRQHAPAAGAEGFHLAGDNALALQLGHRRSADFDWFRRVWTFDPLVLSRALTSRGVDLEVQSTVQGTLHGSVNGVRVSFLAYDHPLLEPLLRWPELDCELAAPADIAAMKLAAIAQRGAKKDFFDLAALGQSGSSLPAMLDAYRRKYAISDVAHVVTALTWFEDAEREPEPMLQAKSSWDEVKRTIRAWVREFAG